MVRTVSVFRANTNRFSTIYRSQPNIDCTAIDCLDRPSKTVLVLLIRWVVLYEIEPFKVLAGVLDVYEEGWQQKVVSERQSRLRLYRYLWTEQPSHCVEPLFYKTREYPWEAVIDNGTMKQILKRKRFPLQQNISPSFIFYFKRKNLNSKACVKDTRSVIYTPIIIISNLV